MSRLIAVLIFLLCGTSWGSEKPPWASHTPPDTAKTLFFVGRSPKVNSEAEGLRMASKDAKEQLLRQEFGTTVKVDTTQTETLNDVSLDSQLSEVSDLIRLRGFKQTDVYTEKEDGETATWALFSIPKSEIKSEKQRLAELQRQKLILSEAKQRVQNSIISAPDKKRIRYGMSDTELMSLIGTPSYTDLDKEVKDPNKAESIFQYSGKRCIDNKTCYVSVVKGRVISYAAFKSQYIEESRSKVKIRIGMSRRDLYEIFDEPYRLKQTKIPRTSEQVDIEDFMIFAGIICKNKMCSVTLMNGLVIAYDDFNPSYTVEGKSSAYVSDFQGSSAQSNTTGFDPDQYLKDAQVVEPIQTSKSKRGAAASHLPTWESTVPIPPDFIPAEDFEPAAIQPDGTRCTKEPGKIAVCK